MTNEQEAKLAQAVTDTVNHFKTAIDTMPLASLQICFIQSLEQARAAMNRARETCELLMEKRDKVEKLIETHGEDALLADCPHEDIFTEQDKMQYIAKLIG